MASPSLSIGGEGDGESNPHSLAPFLPYLPLPELLIPRALRSAAGAGNDDDGRHCRVPFKSATGWLISQLYVKSADLVKKLFFNNFP